MPDDLTPVLSADEYAALRVIRCMGMHRGARFDPGSFFRHRNDRRLLLAIEGLCRRGVLVEVGPRTVLMGAKAFDYLERWESVNVEAERPERTDVAPGAN